jgi:hypothetical protein
MASLVPIALGMVSPRDCHCNAEEVGVGFAAICRSSVISPGGKVTRGADDGVGGGL